jgi:hypothetical protein
MLGIGPDIIAPVLVFAIPIIAIVGGITAGIVRSIGQQRLNELAARERMLAIERGLDPSKLPPFPAPQERSWGADTPRRRWVGLLVAGVITITTGLGVALFLYMLAPEPEPVWATGIIVVAVGLGLLLSAWIVHAAYRNGKDSAGGRPGGPAS